MSWKINVFPEHCTGCRACQMICSYTYENGFQPLKAYITVEEKDSAHFKITFDSRCKNCGLCANYCAIGALVKERQVPLDVQNN
ncbi:MAG: hypothetical protein RO469_17780 [Thermincola sp.]|jgi:formate hydrogenlyase subunit 6/NADH:ubiquinone oxidoreductase subunit I|nr:hypothetical protein [Thermincola sp.]MDT3703023.1 hypothetical protein [Thermincola sp.]